MPSLSWLRSASTFSTWPQAPGKRRSGHSAHARSTCSIASRRLWPSIWSRNQGEPAWPVLAWPAIQSRKACNWFSVRVSTGAWA
jgi:hypothetical protein